MSFRLTLRDLFWLVLVVAMGLGWWNESRSWKSRYDAVRERSLRAAEESEMWKYRANKLAEKVTKDGYHVSWDGHPSSHTILVEPPSVVTEQSRARQKLEAAD